MLTVTMLSNIGTISVVDRAVTEVGRNSNYFFGKRATREIIRLLLSTAKKVLFFAAVIIFFVN
jgi:hypothetical protein